MATEPFHYVHAAQSRPAQSAADHGRIATPLSAFPVAEKSAFDLFLTRALKNATAVRRPNVVAAFEALQLGESDALAAPRRVLLGMQQRFSGSRVLVDWLDETKVAGTVAKNCQVQDLAYVNRLIAEAIASGMPVERIKNR